MSDIAELVQRLRRVEYSQEEPHYVAPYETTNWYRNPDGPEAADALEAQARCIAELEDRWQKILKVLEPYAQGKGPPGGGGPR